MKTEAKIGWLFRGSALLWAIWGLVHALVGVVTIKLLSEGQAAEAIHGLAAKPALETLDVAYPDAVVAMLSQHSWNLLWFGVVTLAVAPFVWRQRSEALYLAAIVGGLADAGYFIFLDLGGYALPPGPQMTWICALAIVTGFLAVRLSKRSSAPTRPS